LRRLPRAIAPRTLQPAERTTADLRLVTDRGLVAPSAAAVSLTRRLRLALIDLGPGVLADDGWAHAERDAIGFDPLSVRQAHRVVRHLEDLAGERQQAGDRRPETTDNDGGSAVDPIAEPLCLFDPTPSTVDPTGHEPWEDPSQPW
jgi:hypothetical protein